MKRDTIELINWLPTRKRPVGVPMPFLLVVVLVSIVVVGAVVFVTPTIVVVVASVVVVISEIVVVVEDVVVLSSRDQGKEIIMPRFSLE